MRVPWRQRVTPRRRAKLTAALAGAAVARTGRRPARPRGRSGTLRPGRARVRLPHLRPAPLPQRDHRPRRPPRLRADPRAGADRRRPGDGQAARPGGRVGRPHQRPGQARRGARRHPPGQRGRPHAGPARDRPAPGAAGLRGRRGSTRRRHAGGRPAPQVLDPRQPLRLASVATGARHATGARLRSRGTPQSASATPTAPTSWETRNDPSMSGSVRIASTQTRPNEDKPR